ncbi:MAG: DMT family transporter [Candidatus Hermodarchaeia archaeon]|jgi:drug/metabolite transporter (DMT)-like permease
MDKENVGTIFILIGLFVYGIHPVVAEFGGLLFAPLFFAAIAALIAGLVAVIIARQSTTPMSRNIVRSDLLRLVMAGVLGTFLAYTCLFIGVQLSSSNNAAIILRSELVFALILSYLFLNETISRQQLLWMSLMVFGVMLVVVTNQLTALGIGDLLLLGTPIAWASGHTLAKPVLRRVSSWTAVAYRNLVGGILLLLLATGVILLGVPILNTTNLTFVVIVILIEAGVILLAHILWYEGIRRINLGKATALIAPAPLVTFTLYAVVFQIPPSPWQLVGAAIVIVATILLAREVSLRRDSNTSESL